MTDRDDRAARLAAELAALDLSDRAAQAARTEALRVLATWSAPLTAGADPTHVTASAVMVGPRGVLLHHHRRLERWLQPGGHLDPGEEPAEAARREAAEETGLRPAHPEGGPWLLDVDVHALPRPCRPWADRATTGAAGADRAATATPRRCVHVDVRYLLHADGAPDPPSGESPQVRWFGWEEAVAVADAGLARSLRRAAGTSGR